MTFYKECISLLQSLASTTSKGLVVLRIRRVPVVEFRGIGGNAVDVAIGHLHRMVALVKRHDEDDDDNGNNNNHGLDHPHTKSSIPNEPFEYESKQQRHLIY